MSGVVKRSVSIRGHRTSFSLEQPFYEELVRIAEARSMPLARLVGLIDGQRPRESNLSSALRLYVLDWHRNRPPSVESMSPKSGNRFWANDMRKNKD